jgi:magnesium-transporting ATPase (P-type)
METSNCGSWTCGHIEPGTVATCPRCGRKTRSSTTVRRLGWMLVVIGLFLIGLMGWITVALYPTMSHPGETLPDGRSFTGTADQAKVMFEIFALVIAFGVLASANGAFQINRGRRSGAFTIAMVLFAIVLFIFARVAMGRLAT